MTTLRILFDHLPEDLTINHMADAALLALQGPKAVDALSRLVLGVENLVFMTGGRFAWGDVDLWISRSGYTGEDGFEISLDGEHVAAFADALCAEPEVKPIGSARAIRCGSRRTCRSTATIWIPRRRRSWAALNFAIGSKRRREEANFPGAQRILAERETG